MDNNDLDIKNLDFTSEDTGSLISKTYTEYNWKFTLDGISRNISLYHSKILGRRTIYLGNREICRYQRYTYNFHYSFTIDVHTISITQNEDTYILKIDGIPFNKLLNEQKLSRFNIIREIFADRNEKNKKPNIKPLMTYKGGRGNLVISNRNDSKREMYKTNIYSAYRENDIENDKNIINTSTKRTNNTIDNTNSEYYYNYNDEESSENISNKAIDGGDSRRDEEEDEQEDEDNNEKENNLNDIFNKGNNFDNDDNFEEFEENEEEKIEEKVEGENQVENLNNIKNDNNEDDSSDEEEEEKKKEDDFNNINNELVPIKSKNDKIIKNEKEKKEQKKEKKKKESKKEKKKEKIKNKNNNYNFDEDDIYNINTDNINNESNINNENHMDLLGEEIYNSSRDKDYYNNNNIDNNFNINYFISQQNV